MRHSPRLWLAATLCYVRHRMDFDRTDLSDLCLNFLSCKFPGIAAVLVSISMMAGCSDEQRAQMQKSIENTTQQIQSKVESTVNDASSSIAKAIGSGVFELEADGSVNSSRASGELLILGMGRPNVVRIKNYLDIEDSGYPKILMQWQTQATNFSSLSGTTVNTKLFIQPSADANLVYTGDNEFVEVRFGPEVNGAIEGVISTATISSADGRTISVSGKVTAVFSENAKQASNDLQQRTGGDV